MTKQYSPNMLETFENCPKKFQFKYVKNISMPIDDSIFEFGKNIHALASYYLKKENIEKLENSLSEREKICWNYLKNIEYFGYEVINTEQNILVKINDNFFTGRPDAIVKNKNKYYVLDYKTGGAPKNAKDKYQTMIYSLAVKEIYKTDSIEFVYIDLKNQTEIKIELTPKLAEEYKNKLTSTVNAINSTENYKKPKNCNCEYSKICFI